MVECLRIHPDRSARPVMMYQNLDKLSDPWVQALPGPRTGLSSAVFAEAMAARLCLPSPAIMSSGKVGQPVTRGVLLLILMETRSCAATSCPETHGGPDMTPARWLYPGRVWLQNFLMMWKSTGFLHTFCQLLLQSREVSSSGQGHVRVLFLTFASASQHLRGRLIP